MPKTPFFKPDVVYVEPLWMQLVGLIWPISRCAVHVQRAIVRKIGLLRYLIMYQDPLRGCRRFSWKINWTIWQSGGEFLKLKSTFCTRTPFTQCSWLDSVCWNGWNYELILLCWVLWFQYNINYNNIIFFHTIVIISSIFLVASLAPTSDPSVSYYWAKVWLN